MKSKKTDNANLIEKLTLRRKYIKEYAPANFTVIDCCAGSGHIWNKLRKEYPCVYFGIDKKKKNGRLCQDSARILEAGAVADVVDIDTYGSPWEHYFNLSKNLKKNCVCFLTIGSTMMGGQQLEAVKLAGINFKNLSPPVSLVAKFKNKITSFAIYYPEKLGIIIKKAEIIKHERVQYIAIFMEKDLQSVLK